MRLLSAPPGATWPHYPPSTQPVSTLHELGPRPDLGFWALPLRLLTASHLVSGDQSDPALVQDMAASPEPGNSGLDTRRIVSLAERQDPQPLAARPEGPQA